ncbi:family 1 glycosylhydrolase [Streptomyces sp. NPDC051909]|uniref:family 1 glycosylhydrolase n=1 Tax=Streptomyces sp. NPDC051909 TaxID=3154944 RepID=UPI0034457F01
MPGPAPSGTGHTGAAACDHNHRYPGDIALMRGIGLDGYHFSIAWPRVLPPARAPSTGPDSPSTTGWCHRRPRPPLADRL